MECPLISVIVPVFNVEKYLPQCLDSILNQSYTHIEIIAINDGSKDNSGKILDEYAQKDERIHAIHQINQGVSTTRNNALKLIKGEYVLFIDADDWIDTETIEICLNKINEHQADVCMFCYQREFNNRSEKRELFPTDKIFHETECQELQRRMIGPVDEELRHPETLDSLGTIWGKLYKRTIIEGYQFVDLKEIGTAEDTLFNCQAFQRVKKAVYLNQGFYHYRKFNSSAETLHYKPDLFEHWLNLFNNMRQTVTSEKHQEALSNRIALSILGLGLNECNASTTPAKEKKKRLKAILSNPLYKDAYKQLKFNYFPIHWKLFYFCAKHNYVTGLYYLSTCIHKIIYR